MWKMSGAEINDLLVHFQFTKKKKSKNGMDKILISLMIYCDLLYLFDNIFEYIQNFSLINQFSYNQSEDASLY